MGRIMKVLFMEWKSLGQLDIIQEFEHRGWEVDLYPFPREKEDTRLNKELCERIVRVLAEKKYDFVFSFNYFPVISIACNACKVKYVSWTFDSPFIQLYSNTIRYPYNYVFIFDQGTCRDLWEKGIDTVYYLPMAASVTRYDDIVGNEILRKQYETQISFIGSTYSERKNRFYEKLEGVTEFTKGYLEGSINAQKEIYGEFILEKLLYAEIMNDLMKACSLVINQDGFERLEWVYANYFLARQVTALERKEILEILSQNYEVDLYTYESTPHLPNVKNRGTAEVLEEAPLIYKYSKINLNISLKSILTGIPLRAFDILGNQGFLLSNYQEDYMLHFKPDEDFVYYSSYLDLQEKVEYYLSHEKERKEIAENGYQKVKKFHTYRNRVDFILEVLA